MIIKYLFIFVLLVALLLAINQAIKWYAESEAIFIRTQLKLLKALDILLQVCPNIKPYATQSSNIKSLIYKKLALYKTLSKYGLLIIFYF